MLSQSNFFLNLKSTRKSLWCKRQSRIKKSKCREHIPKIESDKDFKYEKIFKYLLERRNSSQNIYLLLLLPLLANYLYHTGFRRLYL